MFNELTPLLDPLGFIGVYFFYYAANEVVMTPLKLALYSSILIYPFMLIGRWMHINFMKTANRIVRLYVISLAVTFIFWIVMLIWRTIGVGLGGTSLNVVNIVIGWIMAAAIAMPFMIIGFHLHRKMSERWNMPKALSLYIITLIMCILFWYILTIWLAYGVIGQYAPLEYI